MIKIGSTPKCVENLFLLCVLCGNLCTEPLHARQGKRISN